MPQKPRWRGSRAIHLQPGYPEYFSRADVEGYRLVYGGPYKTLMASKPVRGQQIQGYAGYYLDDILIKPDGAGQDGPGTMTLSVTRVSVEPTEQTVDETEVEIDAGGLEKSIFEAEAFEDLTLEEINRVKKAVEEKRDLEAPVTLEMQQLHERLTKGVEGFFVGSPQVRKVTTSHRRPTVGRVGKGTRTTNKPDPSAPDGYVWLKMADKATKTGRRGKWQRVEMWAAADDWDELLYAAATPPTP